MQSWQYLRLNIDNYLLKDGADPMYGPLDMSNNKITNLGTGTQNADAVNKQQVDASFNLKVNKAGDTMTGPLNVNYQNAFVDIKTTQQDQNSTLYLSTPYNDSSTKKTAIIANGITSFSRANLHFCLNNTANDSTNVTLSDSRMCILNSGNVGIGTSTPTATLDVNGNIRLSGNMSFNGLSRTLYKYNILMNIFSNKSMPRIGAYTIPAIFPACTYTFESPITELTPNGLGYLSIISGEFLASLTNGSGEDEWGFGFCIENTDGYRFYSNFVGMYLRSGATITINMVTEIYRLFSDIMFYGKPKNVSFVFLSLTDDSIVIRSTADIQMSLTYDTIQIPITTASTVSFSGRSWVINT